MNHADEYLLDRYPLGQMTDEGQLASIEEHSEAEVERSARLLLAY